MKNFEKAKARLREIILERSFRLGEFTLSSGKKSDYYVDCRTTTLHPEGAALVGELLHELGAEYEPDAVGGLTLGADPVTAAYIIHSHRSGREVMGYIVRKQAKGHGTGRRVEGNLSPGMRAVVLEDVITSGGSALQAVEAAREAGAEVVAVLAVVDREEGGTEAIREAGLPVKSLFTARELKAAAGKKT